MSIQGHLLEVTVVGCNRLRDTEWISRQDPYVCLEYASTKFRTRTCTDGGKNPSFQEKFVFNLIEGLREISVSVWNSNTLTFDDLIGSGKVQLHKVLSHGFDDTPWTIHSKGGKHAGEVTLIMHYSSAQKPGMNYVPTAPPHAHAAHPSVAPPYSLPYPAPPHAPAPAAHYAPPAGYPPAPTPSYASTYHAATSMAPAYPTNYTPPPYPAPAAVQAYPPATAQAYPPAAAQPYPPPTNYPPTP
ncbi:hypothetical protein Taro_042995, partial [Colocasia esculenta]|nr:hypothetical protein [Colocasia esculenta]